MKQEKCGYKSVVIFPSQRNQPIKPIMGMATGANGIRLKSISKAAELDGSARIWLCTPQQTSTEALQFLAKNQQLSNVMRMEKQQTPPLEQPILFRSFGRQQTQSKSAMASTTMITSSEVDECEQVWHQAKNTTVGSELMASLEADEIGASVAPGKNHYSRVRVDGANVLTNSSKANVLTNSSK